MEKLGTVDIERLFKLDYRIAQVLNAVEMLNALAPIDADGRIELRNVKESTLYRVAEITGGEVLTANVPGILFDSPFASTSFYVGRHEIVLMSK